MNVAGIILAGGQSRRMGGGDKSLLPLGGGCVLDQVVSRFGPQIAPLALNANGDPARFSRFGLPVLAGILTGLEWAVANTACKAVVTAAGDTPFLPLDPCRTTGGGHRPTSRFAVACSAGKWHPTFALWPTDCRDALRHFLVEEDIRRVSAFIDGYDFVEVDFPVLQSASHPIDPFFNINEPDDLVSAERLLQIMTP